MTTTEITEEERDWLAARSRTGGRNLLTPGRERLEGEQERSIDALVANYGDAMIRVHTEGVAGVFHLEHPAELAWLVNPEGDVAEYTAGPPTYVHSARTVQSWTERRPPAHGWSS